VVLVGHSLGGGLVSGTAGYMVDNDTADRLAGVVLLDGVGLDGTIAASLKKVPVGIPIYQLASPKYFWNQFGVGTHALLEARPNEFIGVTLVGGSHVDSMRGGNPLIQFSQQLVSGFSKPQNVAAAQILMVGWVNDMFADPQDDRVGIYLDPGEVLVLDTPAGQATLVDLPNSLTKPFLLNLLQPLVPLANGFFTFEPTCVSESMAVASCHGSVAA
jgi:pimeloyl-ACP methyl ester carboxylesterase